MKTIKKILYLLPILLSVLFVNCGEDRTYEYLEMTQENQWIYAEMKSRYLWSDSIKKPSRSDFFTNTGKFFSSLLYAGDKASFFTDSIQTTSYGMSFAVMRDPLGEKASDTYALVLSVEPGSSADKCGIKRGNWIYNVNDKAISMNNYSNLEQGNAVTLHTKYIDYNDETMQYEWKEGDTLTMAPSTFIKAQPILLDTVYTVRDKKIGYVVCNRFEEEDFVNNIRNIFAEFSGEGVGELILDLRYNSGGSLESAAKVAGMLLPAEKEGALFCRLMNNKNNDNDYLINAEATLADAKIFILATGATRGAAESFIMAMKTHASADRVNIIGETTAGEYLYTEAVQSPYGFIMNPVVAQIYSSSSAQNPTSGIFADYIVNELSQINTIYPFGEQQEFMLYNTIYFITTGRLPDNNIEKELAKRIYRVPQGRSIIK